MRVKLTTFKEGYARLNFLNLLKEAEKQPVNIIRDNEDVFFIFSEETYKKLLGDANELMKEYYRLAKIFYISEENNTLDKKMRRLQKIIFQMLDKPTQEWNVEYTVEHFAELCSNVSQKLAARQEIEDFCEESSDDHEQELEFHARRLHKMQEGLIVISHSRHTFFMLNKFYYSAITGVCEWLDEEIKHMRQEYVEDDD